ncbi:MAG: hypothetical protein AAB360_03695 [Patescibacteria group bacterium]
MKKPAYFGLAVLAVMAIAIGGGITVHNQKVEQARLIAATRAEKEFQSQLERNWALITDFVRLLPIRLNNTHSLRNLADFEYKRLGSARFRVDESYRQAADTFMNEVHGKTTLLLAELTGELKPEQVPVILMRARDVDMEIEQYQRGHPELDRPAPITPLLESRLKQLVKRETPPPSKIIVVTTSSGYPEWATTSEQRVAWNAAQDIVREYFRQRTLLSRNIDWPLAKKKPVSLLMPDANYELSVAIERRKDLLNQLNYIERVQGMSDLSGRLRAMLENSINGLYCAQRGDYASFKSYNNANDRLQAEIRRTFGIR